jgi:VanZ family protein
MKNIILKYSARLSIIWALIILGLCAMPGQYIPSVSWLEILSFDKWVHAGIFFVLCSLIFFSLLQKNKPIKQIYLFFVLAVLYGCSLEIMQGTLFSNRSADWHDIIANTVGCIFGLVLYRKLFKWLSKV